MASMDRTADADEQIGLLDKERIIAPPGYNRWLVPPAALAIHLCIGMAYGFSVFWLPLGRALGVAAGTGKPIVCPGDATTFGGKLAHDGQGAVHHELRLDPVRSRLDVHAVLRAARHLCRHLGRLARARRPAQSRRRCGALLVRRPHDLGARRLSPPALDDVARLRHHRRLRAWPRLHLAGLDPDQMVPGPPRHGDRHGDHGLRRRRHDRLTARHHADEPLRDADLGRRVGDLRHLGPHLFRVHAWRRLRLPAARGRLEAGRLDAAHQHQRHDHRPAMSTSRTRTRPCNSG